MFTVDFQNKCTYIWTDFSFIQGSRHIVHVGSVGIQGDVHAG